MPAMPAAKRKQLAIKAYNRSLGGYSMTAIAKELEVSRPFATRLVREEIELRHEERDHAYEDARAIERYERVIRKAERQLERENTGNAVPGLLNAILRAQENIDKITGVLAPHQYEDVTEYTVRWNDLDTNDAALDGARAELEAEGDD